MKEISPWRIRHRLNTEDIEPEYTHARSAEGICLADYWSIIVKRRRIILILFFLISSVGAYFSLTATKLYTANATIKIEPQSPQVTGVGALVPNEAAQWGGAYDYYQTQFALLKSRPLAARVIQDLSLDSNSAFTNVRVSSPNPVDHLISWSSRMMGALSGYLGLLLRSNAQFEQSESNDDVAKLGTTEIGSSVPPSLIRRYLGFLAITQLPKTRLVKVEFTTPDPALSQNLANAHAESFLRISLESRFNLSKEAREFLEQKKNEFKQKMEKSEGALNRFRREHGVVSVDKGENIVVDRLVDLNRQLTLARAQRIESESLYRTVENKNSQDVSEVMKQGLIQQLKSNFANLEAERARVATIFKPDHPRMRELTQQLDAARDALNKEVATVIGGIRSNYIAAVAKEQGLQAEAAKQQQDALRLKELAVDYSVLQEEVNANRSLYESVLKRLNETQVSSDVSISNMQLAEKADRPANSSGPNISIYLTAAMLSGLVFGVGVAFLQEYADSTVGTPDDVWRSVGLSTLGVVPHLKYLKLKISDTEERHGLCSLAKKFHLSKKPSANTTDLIINHKPISTIGESYRSIRTSLLLTQAEKPPQVILLTSPSPGDGKTVTTINLAIALAQDNYSVLIIDADMRKGCCHSRLSLRNGKGLSAVLTGGVSLHDSIQRTSVAGLCLLSRGVVPPNPNELLGSMKMKGLIQELRRSYQFILVDSPPIIGLSDAAVLSVVSDGVLLVLNAEGTSTTAAQSAVERLDTVHAKLLGVILNGINLKDPVYSYFRNYESYYTYRVVNGDEQGGANGNGSYHNIQNPDNDNITAQAGLISRFSEEQSVTAKEQRNGSASSTKHTTDSASYSAINSSSVEASGPMAAQADGLAPQSQAALYQVTEALTKTIGPIAPTIVHEHIALLGESRYAFPEKRIGELVKSIEGAITNEELALFSRHFFGEKSAS